MSNSEALKQSLQLLKSNQQYAKKFDKKNSKVENLMSRLDKLTTDFMNDYQLYNLIKEQIKSKTRSFTEKPNYSRQVLVDSISLETKSDFLGCYTNTGDMEYTGSMDFDRCRLNAFDLQKPFFSLQSENGVTNCYVGDNLNNAIKAGPKYNYIPLWQSADSIDTKDSKMYKFMILNTTIAIINDKNEITYSDNKDIAVNELDKVQDNKMTSLFEITDDGDLLLTHKDNVIWSANRNDAKSEVVNEWIPVNNPTNKYKRSYLSSGEFIESNESLSSENGKFKVEFTHGVLRLLAASKSCVGDDELGDKDTIALHMINKSNYDVRAMMSSSGTGTTKFNISKGDCMAECDKYEECVGAEYKVDQTSTCVLKKDIGTIYDDKTSSLMLKTSENLLDDRIYLGKIGYIDENDTLHEYPKSMIKYTDEMYKSFEETTTDGNTIQTLNGNVEDAIVACNKLPLCGGFTHNIETNTIELKDNSIYPNSIKRFADSSTLYTRGFTLDNHNSCNKTYEMVKTDLWKNYDILNKITMVDKNTHKCGVLNLIDGDLKQLKTIFERLNKYTIDIEAIFKSLYKLNVNIDENVKALKNELDASIQNVRTSSSKLEDQNKALKKEGFKSSSYMNVECKSTNYLTKQVDSTVLSLSIGIILLGGLFLYARKY